MSVTGVLVRAEKQQDAMWKLRVHHWFGQQRSKSGLDKLTMRDIVLLVSGSDPVLPKASGPTGSPRGSVRIDGAGSPNVLPPIHSPSNLKESLSALVQSTASSHC